MNTNTAMLQNLAISLSRTVDGGYYNSKAALNLAWETFMLLLLGLDKCPHTFGCTVYKVYDEPRDHCTGKSLQDPLFTEMKNHLFIDCREITRRKIERKIKSRCRKGTDHLQVLYKHPRAKRIKSCTVVSVFR